MTIWRRISGSGAQAEGEQYVAVIMGGTVSDSSLYTVAYPFDSINGFGNRITPSTYLPNRGEFIGGRIKFSNDGGALMIAHIDSPYFTAYEWNGGYGSKYSNPSTLPSGQGHNVVFSKDGGAVILSSGITNSSPQAYSWSDASGFGSKYTAPVQAISNSSQSPVSLAISPNGNFIAAGYSESVNLAVYPWNTSTGFGAKQEPSIDPLAGGYTVFDVAWNNAGTYIAIGAAHTSSDKRLIIYEWDDVTGLGSQVSGIDIDPAVSSTSTVYSIAFTPNDDAIILGGTVDNIRAYPWDNSTATLGAAYSAPVTSPDGAVKDIVFNTNGDVIICAVESNVQLNAYKWSSSTGFGVKYDNPPTTGFDAGSQGLGVAYKDFG